MKTIRACDGSMLQSTMRLRSLLQHAARELMHKAAAYMAMYTWRADSASAELWLTFIGAGAGAASGSCAAAPAATGTAGVCSSRSARVSQRMIR